MKNDILTRYAAVIPVFVEAGCEAPPINIKHYPVESSTKIAVLEQWFHQTVVPWAWLKHDIGAYWQAGGGMTNGIKFPCEPKWRLDTWNDELIAEGSILTCLEALAAVIGGK